MRTSINEPVNPDNITTTEDISDFQAVNDTPGFWLNLFGFLTKIWWIVFVVIGLMALSFPYLFPQWAEKYKGSLQELGIAANTAAFIKNAKAVDWKEAFSKVNLKNLHLVGTGLHPAYKGDPGLKKGTWYTGQVFIMKDYVTEGDWVKHLQSDFDGLGKDLMSPVTGVEQSDAAEYCRAKGGRLPTYEELGLAYYFKHTRQWQGKTGQFLKPNLEFNIVSSYTLWTSSPQGDGFLNRDNFRIFTPGVDDAVYRDDGYENDNLSFLCVMDENDRIY